METASGQLVETNQYTECYIHEGDEEYHCTYLMVPLELLSPNTEYTIHTDNRCPCGPCRNCTIIFCLEPLVQPHDINTNPVTEIIGYMHREPSAIQECDWKEAMKYEVVTEVEGETRDHLTSRFMRLRTSTLQKDLVHSIILQKIGAQLNIDRLYIQVTNIHDVTTNAPYNYC